MTKKEQTLEFQSEIKRMMHIVINSLYSNKEIFLRELISNASDALDKIRFLGISNPNIYDEDSELKIHIDLDSEKSILIIRDNGIGLSRQEAIENLGTIAKSGTKEFLNQLSSENSKNSQLIGQFGVGFYSAFIVSKKVVVKSRKAGLSSKDGIIWSSQGEGEFTIMQNEKIDRGTEIILYIKNEYKEFLSEWRIKRIISKYSDYICWPIFMKKYDENNKQLEEYEIVNKAMALWTIPKSKISDAEYKSFYKHISLDTEDPLIWIHNQIEGKQDYITLLYIPMSNTFDIGQQEYKHGLKLYIKRVFITDEAIQFLPRYLRFVKGIIDVSDLPLNISREILQDNKKIESIKLACTKRILNMLEKLSVDNMENYQKFWDAFGIILKEGSIEDHVNRELISKLLRFASTKNNVDQQTVSFEDYISNMQDKQDKIYYITASSYISARKSPHLEIFRKKNIEVLLLVDRVDEWLVNYINEFNGKKLQSVSKGKIDIDISNSSPTITKEQEKSFSEILEKIKIILGEKIKYVRITNRLIDSPSCIIADENDMGLEMKRILQSAGQKVPISKPIFEINPNHELIKNLFKIEKNNDNFSDWINILFEQAVLTESGQLENPVDFINKINKILIKNV